MSSARRFPPPTDPAWLQEVLSISGPIARPGLDLPQLPGSTEGYQALAALSPEPLVIVDGSLRVAVVNRPFLELMGLAAPSHLIGRSILDTLVEWERVRAAHLVARFQETGVWDVAELTALRQDGTIFPVEARCEMLHAKDGAFAGMLVMVRDLRDQPPSGDPLRAIAAGTAGVVGEEFLASLARNLAEIFSVRFAVVGELVEPDRREVRTLVFWTGDRLAGNFTYALDGTPCHLVSQGETCFYPEGIQGRFPHDEWLKDVGAEGYIGTPLLDSSGQVIGLLEVLDTDPIYRSRDVASIMRIFAARAGAELERLRMERELQRHREELLQRQKLEGIGRLAGGVAHDFNNLLTAILGYTDSAVGSLPGGAPAIGDLAQIRRAALSASALTAQLLTFARRQTVLPRTVQVDALVRDTAPLLERLLGESGQVVVNVENRPWPVRADPSQLEQYFVNLALNAHDAMPQGGTLTVTIENAPAGSVGDTGDHAIRQADWVRLTVSDTGHGMTSEVLALAFEPFFSTKPDGSGLGLATCHGIIRQAGGHVWAESTTGQGTRIVALLPRDTTTGTALPAEPAAVRGGSETILVVEDEPAVRYLAVRALRRFGYQVLEAADAETALAVAAAHRGPLHLVISDVLLPGRNGPDLVRELLSIRPTLGVLFVSGFTDTSFGGEAGGAPGHPFLPKPYTTEGLAATVREILDGLPARA